MIKEIKFHNVTATELDIIKSGIAAKYPGTTTEPGQPIALGHGYSVTWQYVGTDLVLSLDGPAIFFGTATDRVTAMVCDMLGRPKEIA